MTNFGFNYALTNWLVVNLRINYKGERKRSNEKIFNENDDIVDVDTRSTIDAQTLLNIALTFEKLSFAKGAVLQIIGKNILNEDHIEPDWYDRLENDYPRGGRSAYIKFIYDF